MAHGSWLMHVVHTACRPEGKGWSVVSVSLGQTRDMRQFDKSFEGDTTDIPVECEDESES